MKDILWKEPEIILKVWEIYHYFDTIMFGNKTECDFTIIYFTYIVMILDLK